MAQASKMESNKKIKKKSPAKNSKTKVSVKSKTAKKSSAKSDAKLSAKSKSQKQAKSMVNKTVASKSKSKKISEPKSVKSKPAKSVIKKSSSKPSPKKEVVKKVSKSQVGKLGQEKAKSETAKTVKKSSNSKVASRSSVKDSSLKVNSILQSKKVTKETPEQIAASKREKLRQISANETGNPVTPQYITTPSETMLKPFRDAAKKNQETQKKKVKAQKKSAFMAKPLKNGKKYALDLRVHSPMSEGYFSTGGVDPATAMVRLAKSKGLDMIAVTDYHSADFVDVVKEHAKETSVTVLPGVDLKCSFGTCDEVCFIALFPESYTSRDLNQVLRELGIPEQVKGRKAFTLKEELRKVIKIVEGKGGILIPTRLDKTPHRIFAIKELVEKYGFHAFDLVHPENPEYFKENWPSGSFTFLSFSNANALGQIGSRGMNIRLASPGFNGLKSLFSRRDSK